MKCLKIGQKVNKMVVNPKEVDNDNDNETIYFQLDPNNIGNSYVKVQ